MPGPVRPLPKELHLLVEHPGRARPVVRVVTPLAHQGRQGRQGRLHGQPHPAAAAAAEPAVRRRVADQREAGARARVLGRSHAVRDARQLQ